MKQTERIGDVLQQVVAWKGPGGAVTRLMLQGEQGYQRLKVLGKEHLHDTLDESRVSLVICELKKGEFADDVVGGSD